MEISHIHFSSKSNLTNRQELGRCLIAGSEATWHGSCANVTGAGVESPLPLAPPQHTGGSNNMSQYGDWDICHVGTLVQYHKN